MTSPSLKWSLYAGAYAFLCSTVLLLLLSPISNTLGMLLSLPPRISAFVLVAPVAFLGAIDWWGLVERRNAYTYSLGAIYGVVMATSAVLFWVLVFAIVWGASLVLVGGVLVVFVVSLPAAVIMGIPLMYARRNSDDGLPNGTERAPQ